MEIAFYTLLAFIVGFSVGAMIMGCAYDRELKSGTAIGGGKAYRCTPIDSATH